MATVQNICDAAYRKCGIRSPDSDESAEALEALNNMVSLWGVDLIVPNVTNESFNLVVGQSSYTIGSGGDFDTVRPISIISAFIRDSDDYDYPVRVIAPANYKAIKIKTLEQRPNKLYYLPEYSLGKIYFNSEPDTIEAVHLESWKAITEFANLSATVDLPNEYKQTLIYNLAVILAEENSLDLPQTVLMTAATSYILVAKQAIVNRLPAIVNLGFNSNRSDQDRIVAEADE